jgi:hypothetical protein
MMYLYEGGNVFKHADGTEVTRRINRAEIPTTIAWLEQITGLDFSEEKDEEDIPTKWLGTTGRKDSSGDLDLSVDDKAITKDVLAGVLAKWCQQQGIADDQIRNSKANRNGWVALTGDSVHFKTPVNGDPKNGFAQTDFMFGDPKWQAFAMKGARQGSQLTGMSRHVILSSIVNALNPNLKWSYKNGLVDRASNETIDGGKEPQTLSKVTGIPVAKLNTADDIIAAIKNRPDYQQLVAGARETLSKSNITLPEAAPLPGTAAWFRTMGHNL